MYLKYSFRVIKIKKQAIYMHSKLTNRLRTFNRSIHILDKIVMPKYTCENLIGQKKVLFKSIELILRIVKIRLYIARLFQIVHRDIRLDLRDFGKKYSKCKQ